MRGWFRTRRIAVLAAVAAVGACGGGEGGNSSAGSNAQNEAVLTGEDQLTGDPEILNEAAADEAADMEVFGGNAAAGETGNLF